MPAPFLSFRESKMLGESGWKALFPLMDVLLAYKIFRALHVVSPAQKVNARQAHFGYL